MVMRESEKKLRRGCWKNIPVFCDPEKVRETTAVSRKAFCEQESLRYLTEWEFIYVQGTYIRKRWWVIQGMLLLAVWGSLALSGSGTSAQRSLGVAAPLFVMLIIPELWKNRRSNAVEVEGAALYSIRQICGARLILFGMVDLVLLSMFFLGVWSTGKLSLQDFMIQFLVPFDVAGCVCFRLLYSRRAGSERFALLGCMAWTLVWQQLVLSDAFYSAVSMPVWGALLGVSALYLVYWIKKGQENCYKLWEVTNSWN